MTIRFLIFFFCVSINLSLAQDQQIVDSLLVNLTNKSLGDDEKVHLYQDLTFYHPDIQEGLKYAKLAVELAIEMNDSGKIAGALDGLSSQQRLLGDKVKSFETAFQALSIYEIIGHRIGQADVNMQLGTNYGIDKNYQESKKYLFTALKIYEQLKDSLSIGIACINLGETLRLSKNGEDSLASFYLNQALVLSKLLNDVQIEAYALGNLGMISHKKGQFDKAKTQLDTAITILNELGDVYSVAVYQAEIGQIYLKTGKYEKGEQYLLEAFALAKQEQLKEQIRDISKMLTDFYSERGNYQKALSYQQVFQVYQDSLVNKENVQQLEQLKANYEIEKRETAITVLETENERKEQEAIALTIGISVLGLLAVFLVWNIRQRRIAYAKLTEKKALVEQREQEKALLLRELNHRVKNNLQMISSLLNLQSNQLKDHPAMAAITAGKLRVEAMSLIHQKLYQEDHHTQIPMKDYIEELVRNLQFAYSEKTKLNFQVQDLQLDIDVAIPIALIVNELVVNAFKYAYQDIQQPELLVELQQEAEKLKVTIQDNGIGMKDMNWEQSSSFGLKLVHSLVQQLDGKVYMTNGQGSAWHVMVQAHKREVAAI